MGALARNFIYALQMHYGGHVEALTRTPHSAGFHGV